VQQRPAQQRRWISSGHTARLWHIRPETYLLRRVADRAGVKYKVQLAYNYPTGGRGSPTYSFDAAGRSPCRARHRQRRDRGRSHLAHRHPRGPQDSPPEPAQALPHRDGVPLPAHRRRRRASHHRLAPLIPRKCHPRICGQVTAQVSVCGVPKLRLVLMTCSFLEHSMIFMPPVRTH
jgi:hypothetical protein